MLTFVAAMLLAQSAATEAATDAWTSCLVKQIERNHRGSASPDAVVNGAMTACAAQELNVRRGVEKDFGNYTAAEVSAELDKLNRHARKEMRGAVVRLRGQSGGASATVGAAPRAPVAAAASGGRVSRPLVFFNKCHYPVRYFVYHIGPSGQWRTLGWYSAPAGQPAKAVINASRQAIMHREGEKLYRYAETTGGGPFVSWHGAQPVTFGGARYSASPATLSVVNGKFQFGLECNGR